MQADKSLSERIYQMLFADTENCLAILILSRENQYTLGRQRPK